MGDLAHLWFPFMFRYSKNIELWVKEQLIDKSDLEQNVTLASFIATYIITDWNRDCDIPCVYMNLLKEHLNLQWTVECVDNENQEK